MRTQSKYLTDGGCTVPRAQILKTVVGMAHFAGSGPDGARCGQCTFHQIPKGAQKPICLKYQQLTGDGKKRVPSDSAACRYYEAKPAA